MRVIINAGSIFKGGAEQVANSFINECRYIEGNDYHIILCDNIYSSLQVEHFPGNFHFYKLDKRPGSSLYNLFRSLKYYDQLEKNIHPDIVISTGGHGYWKPKAPIITGFNIPHYVYPESPYFRSIPFSKKIYWKLKKRFDLHFYKKSDTIIVQTDDVNDRVKKLIPGTTVVTVSNTVNGVFLDRPKAGRKLQKKSNPKETRLLTVSANYPHKNLDVIKGVLDNLIEMKTDHIRFVLTLPDDAYKNTFSEKKYQNYIINVGPVTINDCPSLYDECDMMFLPTLLECFSASYVEAMAMRKPILTSDLGFAHTVCKDAAVYFNPVDGKDIAEKIIVLDKNPQLQCRMIENGEKIFKSINTPQERALTILKIGKSLIPK